ncbi:GNAT family N-acetyltransferase [Shewanella sp. Isolate7]|uniref:GNAT family N-acetyltransferase n=1 Tax=Shewanella sp. Isolate7 TaxID=2908528 RepID=UPI001EFD6673|nr:GNAT family N-acetyltransferase [Shewanella sp. Isolate7]MCG9720562.1 GNAT family N-acetyltransferase [Shewanella sp. Isolate7]
MRPIAETDRELYRHLYCNERVMRHISQPFSQTQADRAFETSLKAMTMALQHPNIPPSYMLWIIANKTSGVTMGVIGLNWNKATPNSAEIGIMMLPKAQGKLLADEAVTALIEHSKKSLNIKEIKASFSTKNLATKRIVKKLGFKQRTSNSPLQEVKDITSENQLEYFLNFVEKS